MSNKDIVSLMNDEDETEVCFFCGSKNTVLFSEHYTFCKECTAIYSEMIVIEKHCKHIGETAVVAEREPWFRSLRQEIREKKLGYILEGNSGRCSVCQSITIADGW